MSSRLAARIGVLAMGAALLVGSAARAQEHVRLVPQLGNGAVQFVAFSPDGRFVVTLDGSLRLWDVTSGNLIRVLVGNANDQFASAAVSPDGRLLVTEDYSGLAQLWDAATGNQIRSFEGHSEPVEAVSVSPDSRFVLTGGNDKTAGLWDIATGKQIRLFAGHAGAVHSVAFSPDGRFILTGSDDGTARLWDVATGKQIRSFDGQTDAVYSVAFSPDGSLVLTGNKDGTARLWHASTGDQIRSFQADKRRINVDIYAVAFSPDGRSLLTGGRDGAVHLWDAATGQRIRSFEGHANDVGSVAFSPDGRFVLTGSVDSTARLWDAASGQQIRSFEGHTKDVKSAVFSPDGRYMLTGISDGTARLWDSGTGQQIRVLAGHKQSVGSVAFSADGRFLLTGSYDKSARLWDAATGQVVRSFEADTGEVGSVAFSPDSRFVLTGLDDNTARLWDASSGHLVQSFGGAIPTYRASVAFSPNGRSVLTGGVTGNAELWAAASGELIRSFPGGSDDKDDDFIFSLALSADDRFVLTGNSLAARLWDASTGNQIRSFKGDPFGVRSVAFSPDDRFVLTAGWFGMASLWDIGTGQKIRSFTGHTDTVSSISFSPDGRFVLTGSDDTTTRLWDAATGKQLATLLSFDNGGWAVTDSAGRYDSNDPDNTPGLVWVTDSNRVIELKQLKDNYYTPNLLASIMKGDRLPEVKGLDLVPAPPEVAIAPAHQADSKHLSLSVTNQGGGVGRVVVSVNDRKVTVLEHPVAEGTGGKAAVTVDLSAATLKPGENTVKVYAFDAGNQIRSHEAVATFTVAANAKGISVEYDDSMDTGYKPQFYGIVVGTSSFAGNHAMDLQYPAHDAESMMTGLEIGAGKLFGKENIHLRLLTTDAKEESGQPTKVNIAAAFADAAKNAKPTDVLLVYLSGHGVNLRTEKDSYYYLTTDAKTLDFANNPELRNLSTVSSAELTQWMGAKNMPLKEVLILDTCAAGAANEELLKLVEKRDVPPDQRRAVEFLKDATGTVILMGSAADKVSYEASKYGQGLLTYALLEGMKGRSIEEGSRLNVSHWFQNASEDVTQLAQSIGGVQKPVIAAPSGTGFPVALLDPADQARIPLAAVKPELVHLSCHDDDDNDPLNLGIIIRKQLREISHPSARGQESEPPILYFDDMTDGPADSLVPKIVYSVSGDTVRLRLRIEQAGKTIKEDHLSLSSADKDALAGTLAAKLVAMAGQVPLEGAKP
jgi:WD40 repeat protein